MFWCYQILNHEWYTFIDRILHLFTSTWILTCSEGNVNHTIFKQRNWGNGWMMCSYLHVCDEILHDFQWNWLSVFHLLVNCVQRSHLSEQWCRLCQISMFLVLHLKSSPVFNSWRQLLKTYSESILNWLTILKKQIAANCFIFVSINFRQIAKKDDFVST